MIRILLGALFLCLLLGPAQARDGWQDHPVCDAALLGSGQLVERCHGWVRRVTQHDNGVSCCADADAFVVERDVRENGNFYVVIQGKQYLVPPEKMNIPATDGGPNPTGQEIGFISGGNIVCYWDAART